MKIQTKKTLKEYNHMYNKGILHISSQQLRDYMSSGNTPSTRTQ